MKVPAYCKCHAKRPVFTCTPTQKNTFSSSRPGQTVTKYCACRAILRVSLKVANRKSQRIVNAMQNDPCSLAHLHKKNTFSSSPRSDRHKVLRLPRKTTRAPAVTCAPKRRSLTHLKHGTFQVHKRHHVFRCTSEPGAIPCYGFVASKLLVWHMPGDVVLPFLGVTRQVLVG